MENISLPSKIEFTPGENANESIASIQPCFPGYGTTMGNSLRRVLLSSLPGTAVTAFKIHGVSHEFTTVDNVKEDVIEIVLNLKQLRLKSHSAEPVRLTLKASGEKKVTAKDIAKNADVEIANPELVICTLTAKTAEIEMDIVVDNGRGYVPSEQKDKEGLETDMILIDSIYTPVKNVGIKVDHVRVGQMTNYENLLLTIETDGSLSPESALAQANAILVDHFNFITENVTNSEKPKKAKKEEVEEVEEVAEEKEVKEEKPKEDKE